MGLVVTSNISLIVVSLVVVSTASMSGFPFEVESVSELDHIPSKLTTVPSSSVSLAFSAIKPLSALWASKILTTGLALINFLSLLCLALVDIPSFVNSSLIFRSFILEE